MPIPITADLSIDDREVEERFVRASGPGGQNVNKVATAVQLRLDIERSSLPAEVKVRLRRLSGSRLTTEGVLVVDAREHRTQGQNRAAARERLVELVRRASRRPRVRRPTKPGPTAEARRLETKRLAGARKRQRARGGEDE
jgi:ribosome-associated protein